MTKIPLLLAASLAFFFLPLTSTASDFWPEYIITTKDTLFLHGTPKHVSIWESDPASQYADKVFEFYKNGIMKSSLERNGSSNCSVKLNKNKKVKEVTCGKTVNINNFSGTNYKRFREDESGRTTVISGNSSNSDGRVTHLTPPFAILIRHNDNKIIHSTHFQNRNQKDLAEIKTIVELGTDGKTSKHCTHTHNDNCDNSDNLTEFGYFSEFGEFGPTLRAMSTVTTSYKYTNGLLSEKVRTFLQTDTSPEKTTYTHYVVDPCGNWIERKKNTSDETIIQRRTISYYYPCK